MFSDNLQANRKPARCEAARNRDRRQPGYRYCIACRHPVYVGFHTVTINLSDPFDLDWKRCDLRNRQNQELVTLKELRNPGVERSKLCVCFLNVTVVEPQPQLYIPNNSILNQITVSS